MHRLTIGNLGDIRGQCAKVAEQGALWYYACINFNE